MAQTRHTTGNSKPRVFTSISTEPGRKRATVTKTKKRRGTTTTGRKTGAGVTKRRAPAAHHKRKSHVSDKIEGVGDKIMGKIEHKPGKKAAGTKKIRGTDGKHARGTKKTTTVKRV